MNLTLLLLSLALWHEPLPVYRTVPCQQEYAGTDRRPLPLDVQMGNDLWTCDVVYGFYRNQQGQPVLMEPQQIEGLLGRNLR